MKFLCTFLTAFLATSALASTPYSPEVNRRFKNIEQGIATLGTNPASTGANTVGVSYLRVARVAFDSATHGTSSATAYDLGVTLPAKSIIWDGMIYVTSTFTSAGSVALECEDSGNLLATKLASSFGSTGASVALLETGTAASARAGIAASCAISAKVTGANVVGKFDAWIYYLVHD